jgi:hypothetical protein
MMELDFEIDKLTHSLEDALTGEIFQTEIVPATKSDLKVVTKHNGWKINNIQHGRRIKQTPTVGGCQIHWQPAPQILK